MSQVANHDGETYDAAQDKQRLNSALERTYDVLLDYQWHSLSELASRVGCSEAGVSARVRDLRKPKFQENFPNAGVQAERVEGGLWHYRLVPAAPQS